MLYYVLCHFIYIFFKIHWVRVRTKAQALSLRGEACAQQWDVYRPGFLMYLYNILGNGNFAYSPLSSHYQLQPTAVDRYY